MFVYTSRSNPEHWPRLLKVIGREDPINDERYASREVHIAHEPEIIAIVSDWTRHHTKQEAMQIIGAVGVPAGAVLDTGELPTDATFEQRGIMQTIRHPNARPCKIPTWPVRLNGSPPLIRPAPLLGGNNEDVLRDWLGMSRDAVGSLEAEKVI